jgi:AraC-like DNA-binding protein
MSEYDELLRLVGATPPALIRVDELAERPGKSRSAVSKGFRAKMGCSLKQDINRIHLQRAHELLQMDDRTIESIANELGCEAPNCCYRFFKRLTGRTPAEYRRRLSGV